MPREKTRITEQAAELHEEPDLVGRYLNDIGSTPLLTADDEVALAKRIEAGVYAAELLRQADAGARVVPDADRDDLAAVASDGRHAKDYMIRANLRLVVSAAKKHLRRGLPFADVIQEGNLGLIHAVEKFDYTKGYKFSTYAMWWIRQSIGRGVAEQPRTVRLPVHVVDQLNKFDRLERKLGLSLGREPTLEELATEAETPQEKIVELRRAAREAISLDVAVGEDGETSVGDLIEDVDAPRAEDSVEQQALTDELHTLLDSLSEREGTVLALRFGLRDGHQHTLQEVAALTGLTRESVRRLEKQALAELRSPKHHRRVLDWAS
ncbi:MAG: sigma-70 family RNA polymerase sigma factor [Pseudonocardiaceae bacterium]|nr:sigma-70 family RNA polymerase sigma factor [Pseudonocardiaceae bacterium]